MVDKILLISFLVKNVGRCYNESDNTNMFLQYDLKNFETKHKPVPQGVLSVQTKRQGISQPEETSNNP